MKKETLLKALQIVKPGLANKEMIEQSTSFAFMDGRVVTYNDEISISHPIPDLGIQGAVKADKLYELLNRTAQEEIDISLNGNEVLIKAGKSKAGLTVQQEVKLPLEEIEISKSWKTVPPDLGKGLRFAMLSCSNDMSRPVLTCVHVNKQGQVESSDNYRISRYCLESKVPKGFLIPASSVKELIKYTPTEMAIGDAWAHFKTEEGTIFSCRVFNDTFPNIDTLLDVQGVKVLLPANLKVILERASIFAKRDHFLDEQVTLILQDKQVKIRAEGDSGWFEESTPIRYTDAPISISVHPVMLSSVLDRTKACVLANNAIKFQGEGWEHVVALLSETDLGA